jgi:anti-sigma B factor antagonist
MPMPPPQFAVTVEGATTVVVARGELDLACRDAFREVLADVAGTVVVDLEEVTFLDSSCIGVLAGAAQRLHEHDGDLRIRKPADIPRRALEITGLASWIDD